jgi:hypothetical protein
VSIFKSIEGERSKEFFNISNGETRKVIFKIQRGGKLCLKKITMKMPKKNNVGGGEVHPN